MKEKIIIENRTKMPMKEIIKYVKTVIEGGKISKTAKGEQYCFASRFSDSIVVVTDKNKSSDRFIVYMEGKEGGE